MRHALARTIALTVLLAGCGSSTDPGDDTPATAFVSVQMLSPNRADTLGVATISGNVVAGRDARGALRDVQSPLQVGGRAFALGGPSDDFGTRHVQSASVRLGTVLGREPLAIEAPAVAGLTPNRPRVRATTVRALDAESVRLDATGALRLHLAIASGDDTAATRRWTLSVHGTQPLIYRGTGHPPAEIVVPRELLPPATGAGQWRAELQLEESHGFSNVLSTTPVPLPAYDVRVLYTQMVLWTVNR